MTKKNKFQTAKGVSDKLPTEAYNIQLLNKTISQVIELFGYCLVDTPILENTELFLSKSGPDMARKLFTLALGKRNICLRPEFTPSMARLYIEKMQMLPKPVKVYYTGPVFRHEQPGESTYRQFTVTGVELFGASGPAADSEIIGMAYHSLLACGVSDVKIVIGNIGLITYLLDQFGLDSRASRLIITGLEDFRKEQLLDQNTTLMTETANYAIDLATLPKLQTVSSSIQTDVNLKTNTEKINAEMEQVLETVLNSVNLAVNSSRSQEEISNRLLLKLRRLDQSERLNKVTEVIKTLINIRGKPETVFKLVPDILNYYGIDTAPLDEFAKTISSLKAYNIPPEAIQIDFGLGRGIHYYTGMVFEIYSQTTGRQLCGGGRYDDMVQVLGGKQATPAVGATMGLERILQSVERVPDNSLVVPKTQVLVIPITETDIPYGITVAQAIRQQNSLVVELDLKPKRNVARSLTHAVKHNIPLVAIVGSEEEEKQTVTIKNLQSRQQHSLALNNLQPIKDIFNE